MDARAIIAALQLEAHPEGGFFRRTYTSDHKAETADRPCVSSIFYLLSSDSPTGHLHCNRSDILHFWQGGAALHYTLINAEGKIETCVLGPELNKGQQLQMLVPGGVWKASQLLDTHRADYGLISEAVCPGFDFADHQMADWATLINQYPQLDHPDTLDRLKNLIAHHD
ncbi:cupin domain-containing protein [Spongiibacter sp. KMU-158]|uniref:Cupin domain-containing protein n=1 Tax=Spongiibacter pelagi TaxID=2760804 RepID=A0A927BY29_9GAMM|nr:cupin domain-containing protein [Spongiibacter pelagi]MBD2857670.1 cupin domain-containing protein [Spongiibacter pelagi]